MKTFKVTYSGTASRFKNFEELIDTNSEREAVEKIYQKFLDSNYFPQEDGCILDCDGNVIATKDDNNIEYDGGSFSAEIFSDAENRDIF